jgi:hypothetical protein
MIPKSIVNGIFWPIILSDFILYSDEKHNYEAYRHIIPWMNFNHQIINENDQRGYIDINQSIEQYGIKNFYRGKCILISQNNKTM